MVTDLTLSQVRGIGFPQLIQPLLAQCHLNTAHKVINIEQLLTARGVEMSDINRDQALVPDSCKVIINECGTAPCMEFKVERNGHTAVLYSLPGVPFEAEAAIPKVLASIKGHYSLSNIFHKLDIPLDLGLKYQPTDQGTDIFDVAVSTQLFNNRVVVNGNIGNKQYSTSGTQNDVVGDLDIEIKIDRSGSVRLNIFSHSADQYTNYLDNSQRNGVGLTYQTEFNNFGQFVRNIFRSKAKRQEVRQAEEEALLNAERVEIRITKENDGKQQR